MFSIRTLSELLMMLIEAVRAVSKGHEESAVSNRPAGLFLAGLYEAIDGGPILRPSQAQDGARLNLLSSSAEFVPRERTGKFRFGKDTILDKDMESFISFEDYAIALVNEIEIPTHSL